MLAALEGDDIVVDILIACVSPLTVVTLWHSVCHSVCHSFVTPLSLLWYSFVTLSPPLQRASLEAVDNDGFTARHLAYQNNHVRTVALLDNARFAYGESKGEGNDVMMR